MVRIRDGGPRKHESHARTTWFLSAGRRKLVELMEALDSGKIEHLVVKNGEPYFEPMPSVSQTVLLAPRKCRLGKRNARFRLKRSVLQLFELFDSHPDVVVDIYVWRCLPHCVTIGGVIKITTFFDNERKDRFRSREPGGETNGSQGS